MKKLLHVIDSFEIGGAEKLLVSVINGLEGQFEQHLIILRKPVPLLDEIPPSCKTTVLGYRSVGHLLAARNFISNYVSKHKIDLVHSQLYWSNIVCRLAVNRKVPLFNSIQAISSEASYKNNRMTLFLEKFTYKKRHHIIGVSKEVLEDFDKWVGLKGNSAVLYNMIDDKFFAKPKTVFSQEGLKLVAVGNLRQQKNYPYLIEAFKTMPANISLDIYGEGDLRKKLQQDIDKFNLNIRLKGHHSAVHQLLGDYDAFLMCSLYEGFSLALMEAMASGLPPIVSDIPVLHEAAGETGIYIDINQPEDLVKKLQTIICNKTELARLSKMAYDRAVMLGKKEQYLINLTKLYKDALAKKAGAAPVRILAA